MIHKQEGWLDPTTARDAVLEIERLPASEWVRYDNEVERKMTIRGPFTGVLAVGGIEQKLRGECPDDLICDPHDWGSGISAVPPLGFLGAHVDYARHPLMDAERALNAIVFLGSSTWRTEWGGELVLMNADGHIQEVVEPRPGTLVMWEPGDLMHRVKQVKGPRVRYAMSMYFLREPCPPHKVRTRALFAPKRD